jgi:mono/diheme cytochrome c family protein
MNASRWKWTVAGAAAIAVLVALSVTWLNLRGDAQFDGAASSVAVTPHLVERGAYLARVGNCAVCHTDRGGAPFAGGEGIATPFGTVYPSNLTPEPSTGIGSWSPGDFWRAMHNGRSKDGRLLYPAFPYPNYTQVTRADSDAIYAYLRTVPAAQRSNRSHALRFPYDTQAALAAWRALYFRPAVFEAQKERSAEWNRGAYLVRGLGHCVACHSTRNALGATDSRLELGGGLIPVQNWYAPSLASPDEAGVADWPTADVVALLKDGTTARGSALGPMAQVVYRSTQHLSDADLRSIAVFLQALPQSGSRTPVDERPAAAAMARGSTIYKDHCAACHGPQGEGAAGAYPALAGARQLTMASSTNVVRVIVDGGFAPTTHGNPRPYGMPPFGQSLSNAEIADVATFVRNAWGNDAGTVSELDVLRAR